MDTILCDISAFYFYRIPPCVLFLVAAPPDLSSPMGRRQLRGAETYLGYIPLPLHELVRSPNDCHKTSRIKQHLWTSQVLNVAVVEIGSYLSVTTPLFTLLSLATHLPIEQLCMAMYEMCGSFSVLRLLPEHRNHLQALIDQGHSLCTDGWRPCLTEKRRLTDIWERPPLVSLDELHRFEELSAGVRGHKRFSKAARAVLGIAASPLEAQAAMTICGPRALGGDAIGPAELNRSIRLNRAARSIAQRGHCVADLYIERTDSDRPLVIECQGKAFHDSERSGLSDSERTEALQSMGYTVIPITSRQLSTPAVYRHIREHIAKEAGIRLRPKTPKLEERERDLRRNLFSDWWMLGR